MHIAVIGAGMIGAAAARHLVGMGHQVTLVGPAEPEDPASWQGPFGSHYDAGRITRQLDPWLFWSRVSRASIARYREIETASGVPFFSEVGSLMAGPAGSVQMNRLEATRDRDAVPCESLRDAELADRFPWFDFAPGTLGLHERVNAGVIDPRALVRAQITLAQAGGARLVRDHVTALDESAEGVTLALAGGEQLTADRALLATGGFSRALVGEALPFSVYARTVVFFEVSEAEAARLAGMPTLIALLPNGEDPYLLPPVRYPDGKLYLKMGGDRVDRPLTSPEELSAWFRSPGDPEEVAYLDGVMRARMPSLEILSTSSAACVTTYTPRNIPHFTALSACIHTAFAGGGRGAKNSDELGRLGALQVAGEALPDWASEPAVA
ncbi:FAD-dependent oxidoreductase [Pseudooceanicola marinus]|uniref:FAD-dependent oxidoreductase n=1 Tax=Pseudooceanicola marinus TaxID=396013 RepID=UPI001CD6BC7C|nr:FAD-dependent oxidoreductase [Pseudooceanicola marinus]MCA1337707.1 FAD-dependent oxidoreductase [Pseudooceanicola marinus]